MASHTPGPWEMMGGEDGGGFVIRMGSNLISRMSYEPHHLIEYANDLYPDYDDGELSPAEKEQYDEAAANAALIAAAPDLLAATFELVKSHEESCPKPAECPAIAHGRAAIAKARARSESASDADKESKNAGGGR